MSADEPANPTSETVAVRGAATSTRPTAAEERYADVGEIGRGGTAEVRRVRDERLRRSVAMKILRGDRQGEAPLHDAFLREARITAQLEHPAIVPVHDLGWLPDGRVYFTMKDVSGRTLREVLREGGAIRRAVEIVRTVSEAVGFAHARGWIHRDLKPDNILIGEFGEVLVVDWGLAAHVPPPHAVEASPPPAALMVGTPRYMAPEQAAGLPSALRPTADVYALGLILLQAITDVPPHLSLTPPQILQALRAGAITAPVQPPHVDDVLWSIAARATSASPVHRHDDAGVLASELGAWLDGVRQRERARGWVIEARGRLDELTALRARAAEADVLARRALEAVPTSAPVSAKRAAWALEDDARAQRRALDDAGHELEQLLHRALHLCADLPEAHALLAEHYRRGHADAEARHAGEEAHRLELRLRSHDDGSHADYLRGDGVLDLTLPPDAEATLYRYELDDRRLVPRELGAVRPKMPLARGRYVAVVRAPGCREVRYPIAIARLETWEGRVHLPRADELDDDDCFVSAGWFVCGGDPIAPNALPRRRLWLDDFVIRRFPVTNREYLVFLDDLVAQGREAEALHAAPRERAGTPGAEGAMIYGRDDAGRFVLRADADGDVWEPEHPVFMIEWSGAVAYARWLAARTGLPWRLPGELEWEKAARGVDGRVFPMGDFLDHSWCCIRGSFADRARSSNVTDFPTDESPYGVRGLAGNAMDWCADPWSPAGPALDGDRPVPGDPAAVDARSRAHRGGSWYRDERYARSCYRSGLQPTYRYDILGFRLARSLTRTA